MDTSEYYREFNWWRRRELNPRPPVLCLRLYMLSFVYNLTFNQPDEQGDEGEFD